MKLSHLTLLLLSTACSGPFHTSVVSERAGATFLRSMRGVCPASTKLVQVEQAGFWTQWCEDSDARRQGPFVQWHDNGQLALEGAYVDNFEEGTWRAYYPGGSVESEGEYVGGKRHGEWIYWFPSGVVWRRGHYRGDQLHGTWIFKNEDDRVIGSFSMAFGNGIRKRYYTNGQQMDLVRFKDGHMDGSFKAWHPNGSIRLIGHFRMGQPVKTWRTYYDDGRPDGTGTLRSKGSYNDGMAERRWLFYHEDGSVRLDCQVNRNTIIQATCKVTDGSAAVLLPAETLDLVFDSP